MTENSECLRLCAWQSSFWEADTWTTQDTELYLSVLEGREQVVHESVGMELECLWFSLSQGDIREPGSTVNSCPTPSLSLSHKGMEEMGQRCYFLLPVWNQVYNCLTDSVSFLPQPYIMYEFLHGECTRIAAWLEKTLKYIHTEISVVENFILSHRKITPNTNVVIWCSVFLHHFNTFPDYSHHSCGAPHMIQCFSWIRHNLQTDSEAWVNAQTSNPPQQQELDNILKAWPCSWTCGQGLDDEKTGYRWPGRTVVWVRQNSHWGSHQ